MPRETESVEFVGPEERHEFIASVNGAIAAALASYSNEHNISYLSIAVIAVDGLAQSMAEIDKQAAALYLRSIADLLMNSSEHSDAQRRFAIETLHERRRSIKDC